MIAQEGMFFKFCIIEYFSAKQNSSFTSRGREPSQRGHQRVVHAEKMFKSSILVSSLIKFDVYLKF